MHLAMLPVILFFHLFFTTFNNFLLQYYVNLDIWLWIFQTLFIIYQCCCSYDCIIVSIFDAIISGLQIASIFFYL